MTGREVDAPWRPAPVQADWATGQLPTPYGPLCVGWENTGRAFRLTVQVPGRTRGSVTFPGDARRQSVRADRRTLWDGRRSSTRGVQVTEGVVTVSDLGPGSHSFVCERHG